MLADLKFWISFLGDEDLSFENFDEIIATVAKDGCHFFSNDCRPYMFAIFRWKDESADLADELHEAWKLLTVGAPENGCPRDG